MIYILGNLRREQYEQEGVVREGSMKEVMLSKFSKHGDVKRKWLPGL